MRPQFQSYRWSRVFLSKIPVALVVICAWGAMISAAQPSSNPAASPENAFVARNKIDELVFNRLQKLGIRPANPCTDAVFIRRVYLDVIGTLPASDEVVKFLADKNPDKRAALIDQLLARDEFADLLGLKWCDLLRVKSEFPVNLWPDAVQAYDHWVRVSIRENLPYSQFAWQLLTAGGSNFRVPPVNFYRSAGAKDPKAIARVVALAFMGERADAWPAKKLDNMAVFFSQVGFKATNEWKEEIVFYNGMEGDAHPRAATLPDGTTATLEPGKDPREIFAHWLITSKNSPFARNAVNRTWFFLFGRGIIQEPDDARPDNPPCNPELLDWLAQQLVASHYDMKQIYRLILNSKTYQLSCIPSTNDPREVANFACYPLHRIEAEVLIDAIDQITGSSEEYTSMIPEPYTFVSTDNRSIQLADGSIGSAFLEMFGRPPRDTGLLSERRDKVSSGQRLTLLNSSTIQAKLTRSTKLRDLMRAKGTPADIATQIYLTILSRYPTPEELDALKSYSQTSEAKGPAVMLDLTWALINSSEFLYHH